MYMSPHITRARNLTSAHLDCQIMETVDKRIDQVLNKSGKLAMLQEALVEAYDDGTIEMNQRREQLSKLLGEVRQAVESVRDASKAVASTTRRAQDDDVATERIIRLESMVTNTYEKASGQPRPRPVLYPPKLPSPGSLMVKYLDWHAFLAWVHGFESRSAKERFFCIWFSGPGLYCVHRSNRL